MLLLTRTKPTEILNRLKRHLPWKSLTVVGVVAVVIVVVKISEPVLWPGGVGLSKGESVATKTVESVGKNAQGQITKTVETTKIDDGKTLWDWLSLLGVPLSLAILGYWLQQAQQKRAEKLAEEQRELAADETKEEVLQAYFDRLSMLLVDKNLLALAAKIELRRAPTPEEIELLNSAVDVIRARTLSILRRFEKDPERKTSVIRFLIEADIVSKLKLNLSGANLSDANLLGADLSGADLSGANLIRAKLSGADLNGANLSGANLIRADLNDADLNGANLSDAKLILAKLNGADLSGANLSGAKLNGAKLNGAKLNGAKLSGADLSGADLNDAKLICADLSGANLIRADLNDADLNGANLSDANLFSVYFNGADLSGANLNGANLFDAYLIGTKLSGANLNGADLSDAKRITVKQLQDAKLCQTKLPPDISLNPNRDCKELELPEK
jgi:uncharacterized protein YjbI with pentapeptide repeats